MAQFPIWLEKRAFTTPHRIAVQCDGEQWTFLQLRNRARTLASQLASHGAGEGRRVALLCGNSVGTLALIHAVSYAGSILLPLNTRLAAQEIAYQLQDAGCNIAVYDEGHAALMADAGAALTGQVACLRIEELEAEASECAGSLFPPPPLCLHANRNAIHTIMYTSGTTGKPKGVQLTYDNHWHSAVDSMLNIGLSDQDRWLMAVPMFHISGLSIVMRSVIYGMPIVLLRKFDPADANEAIMTQGVTIVSVVSNMLIRMLDELGGDHTYPPVFRCMLLGGGPAPLPLLQKCAAIGIPIYQTYGMTETASQIVTLSPEYMFSKLGSAGKPLFQSELRIIVDDGSDAAPGEPGEIIVRGPTVMSGYWNLPEPTAHTLRDGWLYTGDAGYLDADGFLFVLDRQKDMFVSGGENVYPAEIEAVLSGHPAIAEAGVVGVEDKRWGYVPSAFICLRGNAVVSSEEIRDYCAARLAKYKVPAHIHFVAELPRNASNKLLRRELKQR